MHCSIFFSSFASMFPFPLLQLICALPAGAGSDLVVSVTTLTGTFVPTDWRLSYALPVIQRVSSDSCEDEGMSLVNCTRAGGDTLVITGLSFLPFL